eukprot:353182-Chlamydomonas_euryale.AAC.67
MRVDEPLCCEVPLCLQRQTWRKETEGQGSDNEWMSEGAYPPAPTIQPSPTLLSMTRYRRIASSNSVAFAKSIHRIRRAAGPQACVFHLSQTACVRQTVACDRHVPGSVAFSGLHTCKAPAQHSALVDVVGGPVKSKVFAPSPFHMPLTQCRRWTLSWCLQTSAQKALQLAPGEARCTDLAVDDRMLSVILPKEAGGSRDNIHKHPF